MLLGKTEVNHVDIVFVGVESDDEVRRLDVSVDIACVVQLLNGFQHLKQDIDGCLSCPSLLQGLLIVGEVLAHELHDDAVRLFGVRVGDEIEYFANVL